jgi:thioredoxin-dependent peroxiredoxin
MEEFSSGVVAPEFSLPDQDGNIHSLRDYRGSWVLLYFYPKDDTPGCTTEACGIRDSYTDYEKRHVTVLGVSIDPITRHKKFIAKYDLPFTLLSDVEKKVVARYGVWGEKKFMGRTYMGTRRESFLIDPEGIIRKRYRDVQPSAHAQEVLEDVATLSA